MCIACLTGYPRECFKPNGKRCVMIEVSQTQGIKRGGPKKEDSAITDPKSTGRKRAAILLPLKDDNGDPYVCAWAHLRNAGGGEYPIVGCLGNLATHRHHGPDKNTLNNDEVGINLHRICTFCHNRWHALNDPGYEAYVISVGGITGVQAHDAETKATPEELIKNESRWKVK